MPSSINGIGTHYYGKKNKLLRKAVCQYCTRISQLTSYETRLWFVVVYVPLIPLGRKRIVSQCEACGMHAAMPVRDWETSRQSTAALAIDAFRQEKSELAAIDVHHALVAFQQYDEAEIFRQQTLTQFADKAQIRTAYARQLENNGLPEEADKLWDEAVAIDPDLPDVRIGMSYRLMHLKKLNEAREQLNFLEEPGAQNQYDLTPLTRLAAKFQHTGDHEQAMELFAILLTAFPNSHNDHGIRALVQTSEKALKQKTTILQPLNHSVTKLFSQQYSSNLRWVVGIAAAVLLGIIGMLFNNIYVRGHRQLTVINVTGQPANIQIDDDTAVTVGTGMNQLTVAEGERKISISGPVTEQHELNIQSTFWQRWSRNPVWIVNVGGEAVVADMKVHYSHNPRPPSIVLRNDPIISLVDVDYAFVEPPKSMEVDSKNSVRTVTALEWIDFQGSSESAFLTLNDRNPHKAFDFASRRLTRDPDDTVLLNLMTDYVPDSRKLEFKKTLASRLDDFPVRVEWHRAYQDIPELKRAYEPLIEKYDSLLESHSDSAELQYLRGRIEKDPAKSESLFAKSIQTDPTFAFGHYAMAFQRVDQARWPEAYKYLEDALEHGFSPARVENMMHIVMLAQKLPDQLESTYRRKLQDNPADISAALKLCELLVVSSRAHEAKQISQSAVAAIKVQSGSKKLAPAIQVAVAVLHYITGDFENLKPLLRQIQHSPVKEMLSLELGDMAGFEKRFELGAPNQDAWLPLICCLAFEEAQNSEKAEYWFQKQLEQLEILGPKYDSVREILAGKSTSIADIEKLKSGLCSYRDLPLIFTALGIRADDSEKRKTLFAAARTYMYGYMPPNGLIERIQNQVVD